MLGIISIQTKAIQLLAINTNPVYYPEVKIRLTMNTAEDSDRWLNGEVECLGRWAQ